MPVERIMSTESLMDYLASIETGGDVVDFLLDPDGLQYGSFVDVPSGIARDRGNDDWYEAHLVDDDGETIIRYIELGAAEDRASFGDLTRHLKRNGRPTSELFTVVSSRKSDDGPLTSPLRDDLTFLSVDEQFSARDVDVTFDLTYFTVERSDVEPASLDFLETLTVGSGQARASLEGDVTDVFSIREITRRFYEEFGEIFRGTLQESIHGLEDPEANRNAYTRTVVNRILFLLFIEEKGWLDGDTEYVENRYEAAADDDEMHVYHDVFEPLFFEALSDTEATEYEFLGRIPFLNGGLFERREIESDVSIDEAFFDALLDPDEDESGDPKGFLRRYKISLRESNPSEQELVVDPEFIGRIFEMFMQADERSEVGAFYTPKPITTYMTKNALKRHLRQTTDLTHEQAVTLVTDHSVPESLTEEQAAAVDRSLRSVTVLDPAVGSGAFIIAMLEELVAVAEAIDDTRGDERTRFRLKKAFIADTLYGVDVDPGGIELCKFRVWLHLMQDLHVSHEEFVAMNDELALPNLGFKFFVGNSLVGEHDPTRIDVGSYQETLTGGLDETIDEIQRVRSAYLTAHGDEKARLGERLDELTSELDTQLAVKHREEWMTGVEATAGSSFAWSTKIPEVILNGGFDITIGNPPYLGGGDSPAYVNELGRYYNETYDFYKRIPRMQYDLYQKFVVRGWELTAEDGILSYITSNTFYTIGSKETTRRLLQKNRLYDLLQANPDTFDAAVNPAIFTLRKTETEDDYAFDYIVATDAGTEQYRSLLSGATETSERQRAGGSARRRSERDPLPSSARGYSVPIRLYRNSLGRAFFEPSERNMDLYESVITEATTLASRWEDEIRDSKTLDENIDVIEREHLQSLEPGDVSILGLLTVGGKGLDTGDNDNYLAYIDGSDPAQRVKQRNEEFTYVDRNEQQFSWMSRVVRPGETVDGRELTDRERVDGIDDDRSDTWVPILKGKGDPYYTPITEFVDWSTSGVDGIREDGLIRNQRYYFEEGIFISRGGTGDPVVRYAPPAVVESSGGIYIPTSAHVSAKYLNGLLNSDIVQHILDQFINGTVNTQVQDMRVVPVVVPTADQRARMEALVDEAIAVRTRETAGSTTVADLGVESIEPTRSISEIAAEIDDLVEEIYDVGA